MGNALYIALEKNIPDVDTIIDGKMLSKAEKHLAKAAKRLGVRPLMEFFSTSADEAVDLLGDDVAGIDIPAAVSGRSKGTGSGRKWSLLKV